MAIDDPDKDILEQAALWAVRMSEPGEPSVAEQARFQEWILADPRHESAYRSFIGISTMAAELPADTRAQLKIWAEENAVDRTSSRRHFLKWGALAAGVVGAVVLGGYLVKSQGLLADSYATRKGQTRVVTFEEGSVAYLNTQTQVRWLGDAHDRRVELIEGEALFDVVHDETRPFRVMLGESEIQVLGTRFDVHRKANGEVSVTVLEGRVQVRAYASGASSSDWTRTLTADQKMKYSAIGLVEEPHQTNAVDSVAWRNNQIAFEGKALADVIEDITRYTDQRIQIRDASLASLKVGGRLSTQNVRKGLERIRETSSVPFVIREENGVLMIESSRRDPSASGGVRPEP